MSLSAATTGISTTRAVRYFSAPQAGDIIREWGKPARELHPGDVVQIPPEVKHWHGAAPDSYFVHLAVEVPAEGSSNEWLEPVSDEEYGKLKYFERVTDNAVHKAWQYGY